MKKITFIITVMIFITGISLGQKVNKHLRKISDCQSIQTTATIAPIGYYGVTRGNLNETFEGTFAPAGWTSASGFWHSSSESSFTSVETKATGHVGHFAVFDAYNQHIGVVGSLETPNLVPAVGLNDTVSYSVDLVQYSTTAGDKGTGDSLVIEFSTNNGTTWTHSKTNVLKTLTGYNTTTTGWKTQKIVLTPYIGQTVKIRFRNISDYGWCDCCIDNVTGPPISLPTNDMTSGKSFLDFDGMSLYESMPLSQKNVITYNNIIQNAGSAAQTNVIMHVNINNSAITAQSTAYASIASLVTDTAKATPTFPATAATYNAQLSVTQNETDVNPANNAGDSLSFDLTNNDYFRTYELSSTLSPYSFGTAAPATYGMEYGATYHFNNAQTVDSVYAYIYQVSLNGTAKIMAKLYTVSGSTFTKVDSSVIATLPANAQGFYAFPLVTPYPAAAGSILAATVALDCTIASHDTIDVGADGGFNGNAALAGLAYLYASSAWGWHAVTGTVPMVGLLLEDISTSINEIPMNNINVYPNPANFALNINSPSVIGKVSIINTLGQLIFENNINSTNYVINTSNFEKGMYVLRIENGKSIITKKVMICR